MIKYIAVAIIVIFEIIPAQSNKVQAEQYYTIQAKDTFYFFLSNEKLLELSSSGNSVFNYVDEIEGTFNGTTHFAVNEHQLLLMHNDSVFVYSMDVNGKFTLIKQLPDIWNIYKADAWNYDFVIHTFNDTLKLLSCNVDSVYIKDNFIALLNGQHINYPYFVKEREVYKYVEGFGYYLIYTISPVTDPGIIYWKGHRNCIVYHTWKEVYPGGPLGQYDLKARKLEEPGFGYQFNYGAWVHTDPLTYSPGTQVLETSFKYIILRRENYRFLYYISGYKKLLQYTSARKFFLYDNYIFNYDNQLTFTAQISDSLIFSPVEYIQPSGVYEEKSASSFLLHQNYPNPFNPSTNIQYSIPERSFVSLIIYDAMGNEIARPVNEEKSPGVYNYQFDGSNLASGVYFYRLSSGVNIVIRKMLLIK